MKPDQVNLEDIQKLIEIAGRYGLEELTVSEKDLSVTVRSSTGVAHAAADEAGPARPIARPRRARGAPPGQPSGPAPPSSSRVPLVSPMTGVFYRAPSPDAPPFVEAGDIIEVGQTIGLIEAMKVFSEVPAEAGGRVAEIVAPNGKLVQADEVLVLLEKQEDENQV